MSDSTILGEIAKDRAVFVLVIALLGGCHPPGAARPEPESPPSRHVAGLIDPKLGNRFPIFGHVRTESADGEDGPVADAVVYLSATDAVTFPGALEPVKAKVRGGRLVPESFVAVVGQPVVVEIEEKEAHSIHFLSPREPEYGFTLPPNIDRWEKTFTKPFANVPITCDIHPIPLGHCSVVPNPNYTRTAKDGSFRLPLGMPPGQYKVQAFHPELGLAVAGVRLGEGPDSQGAMALRLVFRTKPRP